MPYFSRELGVELCVYCVEAGQAGAALYLRDTDGVLQKLISGGVMKLTNLQASLEYLDRKIEFCGMIVWWIVVAVIIFIIIIIITGCFCLAFDIDFEYDEDSGDATFDVWAISKTRLSAFQALELVSDKIYEYCFKLSLTLKNV